MINFNLINEVDNQIKANPNKAIKALGEDASQEYAIAVMVRETEENRGSLGGTDTQLAAITYAAIGCYDIGKPPAKTDKVAYAKWSQKRALVDKMTIKVNKATRLPNGYTPKVSPLTAAYTAEVNERALWAKKAKKALKGHGEAPKPHIWGEVSHNKVKTKIVPVYLPLQG